MTNKDEARWVEIKREIEHLIKEMYDVAIRIGLSKDDVREDVNEMIDGG